MINQELNTIQSKREKYNRFYAQRISIYVLTFLFCCCIVSCSKDHCSVDPTLGEQDYDAFSGSTLLIPLVWPLGLVSSSTNCDFEIIDEPDNGTALIVDSLGVNYTPDASFVGIDQFTYMDYWFVEKCVSIKVWSDWEERCLSEIEKLGTTIEAEQQLTSSSLLTITFPVIMDVCADYIESIEVVDDAKIGELTVDGTRLRYTFTTAGKEEFTAKICFSIDGEVICKVQEWKIDVLE